MLLRVTDVRTDVSEERITSMITVKRIGENFFVACFGLLVTLSVVRTTPILITLIMEPIISSETSVLTRITQRHILEDGTLQNQPIFEINTDIT
jgi:hypothetical protein